MNLSEVASTFLEEGDNVTMRFISIFEVNL